MAEEVELHDNALIEILARLPVKSLIRFTCVCKVWRSLIKSPEFASKHYATRLSLKKDDNEYDCFLASFFPACSISIFSYKSMAFETAFKIRPAVAAYEPPRFDIYHRDIITNCFISGPCNGLFLLRLLKGLYDCIIVLLLWNPATREVFKIPFPDDDDDDDGKFGYACNDVGLGFDHVANDYKVLFFNGHNAKSSLVNLYSLAANYWRQVDAGLYIEVAKKTVSCQYSSLSLSSNGCKAHFISTERMNGVKHGLASFDMVDEVFVETALPDGGGGLLLFISNNHAYPTIYGTKYKPVLDTFEMLIWVLEGGYGPTGVWNIQQSITLPHSVGSRQVMLGNNTDIVFANGIDDVSVYNWTTQERKSLQIPGDGQHVIGYIESVISIAGFIRQLPSVEEDHSSVEAEIGPQEHRQEDHSSVELDPPELQSLLDRFSAEIQERNEEDNGSDSSTDSAFLMPRGKYIRDYGAVYMNNHEADMLFHPYRKNECERLCRLPYCLREVNQPLISNPCTF